MLVLPVYDLLLLPGVTFNFKKDVLERMQVEKVEMWMMREISVSVFTIVWMFLT